MSDAPHRSSTAPAQAPAQAVDDEARKIAAEKLLEKHGFLRPSKSEMVGKGWGEIIKSAERQHESEMEEENMRLSINETPSTKAKRLWHKAQTRVVQIAHGMDNPDAHLVMQMHWLEATDAKHRHGANLVKYWEYWKDLEDCNDGFFHWLDFTEDGIAFVHPACDRQRLNSMCIKYLGPHAREAYEVAVKNGLLYYKQSGTIIDTDVRAHPAEEGDKGYIFVISPQGTMYTGEKVRGLFQHSTFLAGGAVLGAGQIDVKNGLLLTFKPHSGHYRPTTQIFKNMVTTLEAMGVNLEECQMTNCKPDKFSPEWFAMKERNKAEKEAKEEKKKEKKEVKEKVKAEEKEHEKEEDLQATARLVTSTNQKLVDAVREEVRLLRDELKNGHKAQTDAVLEEMRMLRQATGTPKSTNASEATGRKGEFCTFLGFTMC